MEYESGTPLYMQIMHDIKQKIVSGEWPPGMRVPPVRELSVSFGVNPNTAQRSLAELEREGLVYAERTSGRFITKDEKLIGSVRAEMAEMYAATFLKHMTSIGYNVDGSVGFLLKKYVRESGKGEVK